MLNYAYAQKLFEERCEESDAEERLEELAEELISDWQWLRDFLDLPGIGLTCCEILWLWKRAGCPQLPAHAPQPAPELNLAGEYILNESFFRAVAAIAETALSDASSRIYPMPEQVKIAARRLRKAAIELLS